MGRKRWTLCRGCAEPGWLPGFVASAIFPSRVIADFSVTERFAVPDVLGETFIQFLGFCFE